MYTNPNRKKENTNRSRNFEDDRGRSMEEDFPSFDFYGSSNDTSCSRNERTLDPSLHDQAYVDQAFENAMNNEHTSQSTSEWPSPFKMKDCWNYKAILNDGEYPRIKISAKSKVKKSKSKRSRNDSSHCINDNSSPHDNNLLRTRLKISSSMTSSRKKSSKQRKKFSVSLINNSFNGQSTSSTGPNNNSINDLVPTYKSIYNELAADPNVEDNHYTRGLDEVEYAPQYLELKPSVKFRCSRCGTNDFGTMAILQEHMAGCDGQLVAPVTADPLLASSPSGESRHPSVVRNLKIKRKVLLCSSCGTYYQHYNLYVHMRDTHKKEICLFCRNTFSKAHQLWDHLITTHNLSSVAYSNAVQVRDAFKNFFITCCSCNIVFSDQDEFGEHECKPYIAEKPEEPVDNVHRPGNETESANILDNASHVLQSNDKHFSTNTDDETESSIAHDVDEEPITADSSLSMIGISHKPIVSSSDEEAKTPEMTDPCAKTPEVTDPYAKTPEATDPCAKTPEVTDPYAKTPEETDQCAKTPEVTDPYAKTPEATDPCARTPEVTEPLDAEINENLSHSESIRSYDAEKITTIFDKQVDDQPQAENLVPRLRSPCSSPGEDLTRKESDNSVLPVALCDQESEERLYWQQPNETSSEAIPNIKESQENNLPAEPVTNDYDPTSKNEEKMSNWLESDDEMVNSTKAQNENDGHTNDGPSEPPPQPLAMALMLDEPVASLNLETLLKECVRTSCDTCLYCHNAILITVNGGQVASHLRSEHRYMPTKPEDTPEQVIMKIEEAMTHLDDVFLNASLVSKYTKFDDTFACLQCSFSTTLFKELCHHKRKVHHKVIFLCIMCKCTFLYYSQLLCHLCPGSYSPEVQNTLNYHCCFCDQDTLPSAFRLMVHLRKIHQACDICLTKHNDQSELFSHMIKQHKMNHLCYKCNLAYRSRDGINEHLFWKHGTESVLCKRCLQKKWPHAYHFCIPASTYTCDECSRIFTKAVALTVHRRVHTGVFPFSCVDCEQRFISKKLLVVHEKDVHKPKPELNEVNLVAEDLKGKTAEDKEVENVENGKDGKKRRKKKQKKEKTDIEKPLLDELPPLNLSSESDEDSVEEDVSKSSMPESRPETFKACVEDKIEKTSNQDDSSSDLLSKAASDIMSVDEILPQENIKPNDTEVSEEIDGEVEKTLEATNPEKMEVSEEIDGEIEKPLEVTNPENMESSAESGAAAVAPEADLTLESSKTNHAVNTPVSSETNIETPEAAATVTNDESREDLTTKENNDSIPPEHLAEIFIERIRNCLIIEHSYCIPDSIFHSENPDTGVSLEMIAQKLSPKLCSRSREKSSCKSVTPRKRKRASRRESSSSDSSSDSDSSSSSCGSNCSCNQKSNSNCSSSSSGSEYSTTPDKKQLKNSASETQAETTITNDEDELKKEQDSLLNVRESDLDTDIETSDEDFYDKYPTLVPRIEDKLELSTLPVLTMPPAWPVSSLPKKESSSRKNRKRRRAPKIKINVGSQNREPSIKTEISVNSQRRECPSVESIPTYMQASFNDSRPGIHLCRTNSGPSYALVANSNSNDIYVNKSSRKTTGDPSGRRSKRERFKNKFYGYSSSDEDSNNETNKTLQLIKKRVPPKRPPKPSAKQPFIGIRAKKPLIMPPKRPPQSVSSNATTMASTHPSLPPHLYRMPSYIMQQQQQQLQRQQQEFQHQQQEFQRQQEFQQRQQVEFQPRQYGQSTSSSDDSDSDNLIINEPSLNDRLKNNHPNFRFPTYPPTESSDSQRPSVSAPPLGTAGPSVPVKNDERLYCYCRCPYDEVSEMIGCDGANCKIEWFHFECVGIMVPPKGAWYCPQCKNREAVPQFV